MIKRVLRPATFLLLCIVTFLPFITGCGTLEIVLDEQTPAVEPTLNPVTPPEPPEVAPPALVTSIADSDDSNVTQVVAWHGTIHSVPGSEAGFDYFKSWHLNIWPKFGPAVGINGSEPSINDEIERLRDTDVKATIWGLLSCGIGDYGGCQLLVTRISANDGGPSYDPEPVEGWEGTVGRLPAQPGSDSDVLYFALAGHIPVLYSITSTDPVILGKLERLPEEDATARVWGTLASKAQPITGSLIEVERLETVN